MSNIVFRFGRRVKAYRTRQKLSQEKLAENSGLHPTYIGQVERGEKNCTLETAEKIAKGLGMPLTELLHDMPPDESGTDSPEIVAEVEAIISMLMKMNYKQLTVVSKMIELVEQL